MQSIVGVERAGYMWYPQSQLQEGRGFAIFEELYSQKGPIKVKCSPEIVFKGYFLEQAVPSSSFCGQRKCCSLQGKSPQSGRHLKGDDGPAGAGSVR